MIDSHPRSATSRPPTGRVTETGQRRAQVAVVSGGPGAEHDVSVRSGKAIVDALRTQGNAVTTCVVSRDGAWRTGRTVGLGAAIEALARADVVIPALHGPWGEDGTLQGLLETIGVPYVGSGVLASATCMDKERTKLVLAAAGIPVAGGRVVDTSPSPELAAELVDTLGLPLFVKPVVGGSSYGVSRVTTTAGLMPAVADALVYCDSALVEQELRGREIDLAVLEMPDGSHAVSPALEIVSDPTEPFFSTRAKYASDRTRFLVPAPLETDLRRALDDLARRAFRALGCAGLARIDCIVDQDRGPVVNEVNTFPGFTERSQFPRMWAAAGVAFPDLVDLLIRTSLARSRATQALPHARSA
jgi:D-alanine-D-alanine ligase